MIKLFSSDHLLHRSLYGDQPALLTTLDEMSSAEHSTKRPPTTPTLITSNQLLKSVALFGASHRESAYFTDPPLDVNRLFDNFKASN